MPDHLSQHNEDASAAWAGPDLIVAFRGQPPCEEIVYFARRCAAKLASPWESLMVVVETRSGKQRITVRDRGMSGARAMAEDPDVFLAMRNAFDHCSVAIDSARSEPLQR